MNTNQKNMVLATIVAILAAGGTIAGSGLFAEGEFENAYVCSVTDEIRIFEGGISSTGYTGYPYTESRSGYVRCVIDEEKGVWVKLGEYIEDIDINVQEDNLPAKIADGFKQYECDNAGCIRVI